MRTGRNASTLRALGRAINGAEDGVGKDIGIQFKLTFPFKQ